MSEKLVKALRQCRENGNCDTCEYNTGDNADCIDTMMAEAADELEAADKRIAELEAAQRWISVKDRLPEENGSYLVFYHEWSDGSFLPTYEDCAIRVMRFLDSRKWRYPVCVDKRCEADTHREVTHWMPLPEPPKED